MRLQLCVIWKPGRLMAGARRSSRRRSGTSPGPPASSVAAPGDGVPDNAAMDDGYRAYLRAQAASESGSLLEELEKRLESTIDTLWQSAVCVEDFKDAAQEPVLHANIAQFMEDLNAVSSIASQIDFDVPVRVLEKVDSGGNPDSVTKEFVELCRAKNAEIRGRVFATRLFCEMFNAKLGRWNELVPIN